MALPHTPEELIRLLSHRVHGVELLQIILDIFCIFDSYPSNVSLIVIYTGVFALTSIMVSNRQAGENTIMLWVIRNVERNAVNGIAAFYTLALAEGE